MAELHQAGHKPAIQLILVEHHQGPSRKSQTEKGCQGPKLHKDSKSLSNKAAPVVTFRETPTSSSTTKPSSVPSSLEILPRSPVPKA